MGSEISGAGIGGASSRATISICRDAGGGAGLMLGAGASTVAVGSGAGVAGAASEGNAPVSSGVVGSGAEGSAPVASGGVLSTGPAVSSRGMVALGSGEGGGARSADGGFASMRSGVPEAVCDGEEASRFASVAGEGTPPGWGMVNCTSRSAAAPSRIPAAASTESGSFDRACSDTGGEGVRVQLPIRPERQTQVYLSRTPQRNEAVMWKSTDCDEPRP